MVLRELYNYNISNPLIVSFPQLILDWTAASQQSKVDDQPLGPNSESFLTMLIQVPSDDYEFRAYVTFTELQSVNYCAVAIWINKFYNLFYHFCFSFLAVEVRNRTGMCWNRVMSNCTLGSTLWLCVSLSGPPTIQQRWKICWTG